MAVLTDALFTPAEAARLLGVRRETVYGKIASGELPAARLGDGPKPRIRIPAGELERFLAPRRRSV